MNSRPAVVVTGASTGIGEACAQLLAEKGFMVFGSVRKTADAERLKARFGENFAPLFFDVTDAEAVLRAAKEVENWLSGRTLAGLVNNAGIAVPGPLLHVPIADLRRQLEVNLIGQMQVTQAFAPLLGARDPQGGPPGRIVNMSSVAGRIARPFFGPYNASKFGLEGLSDALRRELTVYGIKVVVIQPGMISTPIWDKAEDRRLRRLRRDDLRPRRAPGAEMGGDAGPRRRRAGTCGAGGASRVDRPAPAAAHACARQPRLQPLRPAPDAGASHGLAGRAISRFRQDTRAAVVLLLIAQGAIDRRRASDTLAAAWRAGGKNGQ